MTAHQLEPDLSHVPSAELKRALEALERFPSGAKLTRTALAALRLGHLWPALEPFAAIDASSLAFVLGAILNERAARPSIRVELVWTGGEAKTAYARPTASVVRELFEHAEHHVLIAGYSFDHGATILAPLYARMLARGVAVDLYLHIARARAGQDLAQHLEHEVASFFAANWPFGPPHPNMFVAPSTIDPALHESLHAKCIVADERVALLGSANFTDRGQSRNIEVGARIEDAGFAQALVAQFRAATSAGVFSAVSEQMDEQAPRGSEERS
jgi:phosphatidylserine/phosphatidylglycerophosphate/cardiolipin synthase-like enzyme